MAKEIKVGDAVRFSMGWMGANGRRRFGTGTFTIAEVDGICALVTGPTSADARDTMNDISYYANVEELEVVEASANS